MSKIAYIIPGYGGSPLEPVGKKIGKFFVARGIKPVYVKINWDSTQPRKFKDFVAQFLKQYKRKKNDEVYVLGFSYGATIAFLSEPKTRANTLILCSLSPYFTEDLAKFKPEWLKYWRKNFIESDYSFNELAPKIKAKTFLFVGAKEGVAWGNSPKRAREGKRLILGSKLKVIKGAKHNLRQKEYLAALREFIATL